VNKQTIQDVNAQGKRVIVRVDFNVPQDANGAISDDTRIVKSLPTIQYLIEKGAIIILMSHLGRPKGKKDPKYTLEPVSKRLSQLLNRPVRFIPDCIGPVAQTQTASLKAGEVALLENLRFYGEEEKNDPDFSKSLASLAEIYVNDAFGAAHRAHASTEGIAKYLPAVAGFLLAKEIEYFDRALQNPEHPFAAILGGAKVVDKIKVIENLMTKVDSLLIGGAMAYTFLKAQGHSIGNSKFDSEGFDIAKHLLEKAKSSKVKMLFPEDHVVVQQVAENAAGQISAVDIADGWIGVDIGPKTIVHYRQMLQTSKTIVWNGPLGIFEMKPFANGTTQIAECLASLKSATTIIGGGETAAAVADLGLSEKMSHVSTGGGASLEYLEGQALPGVEALLKKK
jgi:phosphoglycerate kinase